MITHRRGFILLVLLLLPLHCVARDNVVRIGVADFPPYSIVDGEIISGVEVEIAQQSLMVMGYKVKLKSYPYGRLPLSFRNRRIDATIVTQKNFKDIDVYYSGIVLPEYQTVAVHLKAKNFHIEAIRDLHDRSILAHQRANLFYGEEYKRIAEQNKESLRYQETPNQDSQVLMLFKKRVDVIVLAHEIFMYYKSRIALADSGEEYVVAKIFGEKFGFYNAFWDQQVRDDFNIGLAKIKQSGLYDQILAKYLVAYSPRLGVTKTTQDIDAHTAEATKR